MLINDFDYDLPRNLIASRPLKQRDHSRLLILHPDGKIEHRYFFHIAEYLNKGDLLIINDTKVFPARIIALKPSGGKIDVLLVKELKENIWEVMYRGKYEGEITIGNDINAEIWIEKEENWQDRKKILKFSDIKSSSINELIWTYGSMPLPKYIGRLPDKEDNLTYQTVYAKKTGSIAAPTAGLHFTESLIEDIKNRGVIIRTVTLHVGVGTFKPITTNYVANHKMEAEFFEIKHSVIEDINQAKQDRNRVIAVGTTSTRTIEGFMSGRYKEVIKPSETDGTNPSICGCTDIFISPGYTFKVVDCLITNFHLPRSTPLMLVSSLSNREKILKAYMEAINMNYRFFSYGDAMLIL